MVVILRIGVKDGIDVQVSIAVEHKQIAQFF
jgi:hypothetical protein